MQLLKFVVSVVVGVAPEDQRLIIAGRRLGGDELPLASFGIHPGSEVYLIPRLTGC
jgi:hypothetical protein